MKVKFVDSDQAIEKAANLSIKDIFDKYGEPHFRDRERAVIERLLEDGTGVIAIGGGAFMDEQTRALILEKGVAIAESTPSRLGRAHQRRNTRPLLANGDPEEILGTC